MVRSVLSEEAVPIEKGAPGYFDDGQGAKVFLKKMLYGFGSSAA